MRKRALNREAIRAFENAIRRACNRAGDIAAYLNVSTPFLGSMLDDMERGIEIEEAARTVIDTKGCHRDDALHELAALLERGPDESH